MKTLLSQVAVGLALLNWSAASAEQLGLLLIEVQVQMVSDIDRDPGPGGGWTDAFWVKNLGTGKDYGGHIVNGIEILEVPEGFYCLDSFRTGNNVHLNLNYCGEPYFRVVGGRLNNAGRWRVGYRLKSGQFKLFASMESLEKVLADAKRLYPERFNSEPK